MTEGLQVLKSKNLDEMKEKIIRRLLTIDREGISNLIDYLVNKTDYFTAPASREYHSNIEGGLAFHSDNVVDLMIEKKERYSLGTPIESIYLAGYLHDLCKVNFYEKGMKLKKDVRTNKWIGVGTYDIKEELPLGHGEKSYALILRYIDLTDEELLMIRYHMGLGIPKEMYRDLDSAIEKYPSVLLMHTSDYEASRLLEVISEPEVFTTDEYNKYMLDKESK